MRFNLNLKKKFQKEWVQNLQLALEMEQMLFF